MAGAGAACAEIRGPSAVPTDLGPGPYAVGETVPRTGAGTILHQPWYYGLPRAEGAWIYLRVEDDVYRVSVAEYRVIERVTPRMRRWWDDPVGSYAQPERPPRGPLPQIGASDGS
ncbi:hypothetical protein [Wenxinia saemankumensis]|nr:hypothetical protein [Wenxinia saemankumensis]